MNDRLAALSRFSPPPPPPPANGGRHDDDDDDDEDNESGDGSSDNTDNSNTDDESDKDDSPADPIEDIHHRADNLNESCAQIEENIKMIAAIFKRNLTDGTAARQKDAQLEALRRETNRLSNEVRVELKRLKSDNEARQAAGTNNAEVRMRVNIQTALTKRFVELMQRYQQVQTQYQNAHRENIHREATVVRPGISRDEVDTLIDHGDMAQLMQTSLIEGDRQRDKATLALVHIREQHRDIIELEQSIQELYQIFVDMANLVDAQGEMIDQIAYNIEQAEEYTASAIKELKKARVYKTKERKKCCAICMSCGALLAAAAGGIALGLAPLAACSIQ